MPSVPGTVRQRKPDREHTTDGKASGDEEGAADGNRETKTDRKARTKRKAGEIFVVGGRCVRGAVCLGVGVEQ